MNGSKLLYYTLIVLAVVLTISFLIIKSIADNTGKGYGVVFKESFLLVLFLVSLVGFGVYGITGIWANEQTDKALEYALGTFLCIAMIFGPIAVIGLRNFDGEAFLEEQSERIPGFEPFLLIGAFVGLFIFVLFIYKKKFIEKLK
ncbi:MAG: hypothetical protein ACFFA0_13635 [Promethearchaeota archaeon]